MFRAALNMFSLWGLTDEEGAVLLDQPVRTYRRWKTGSLGRMGAIARRGCRTCWGSTKRCVQSSATRSVVTIGLKRPTVRFRGDRRLMSCWGRVDRFDACAALFGR